MLLRLHLRRTTRPSLRRTLRPTLRGCLRGRRGPDDFAQMLTAYGRALRALRQTARLAPRFFDAAVVNRERENRAETLKWMALWEPAIAKAYGMPPKPPDLSGDLPPLPPPATQRRVERHLAGARSWLEAGEAARQRHQQRRPHALPSWPRMARLLELSFDLKNWVLGLSSPNPLPHKITYDYDLTDLKRGYGHLLVPEVPVPAVPTPDDAPKAATAPPATPPPPAPVEPPPTPHRCDAWGRLARLLQARGRG